MIRLVVDPPQRGVRNMAVDEAIMRSAASAGTVTLRFYEWAPGCLSFGRNQAARGAYDPERAARRGFDVLRRPTGGRAVFHRRELTYAVAAPADTWGSLRSAYCRLNRALAVGLRELGIPAECAAAGREGSSGSTSGRAPPPSAKACFRDPLPGEVTAEGRKLVGSAQWRDGGALLQHGSVLLVDEQHVVDELRSRRSPGAGPTGAAAIAEFCPEPPSTRDLVAALRAGFLTEFSVLPEPGELTEAEHAQADALEARFADPEWTWRR